MKRLANNKTAAKLIDERVKAIMTDRVNALVATFALAMLDKGRLSKSTVEKVLNGAYELCDSIINNYVSFQDIEQTLLKDYNVRLDFIKHSKRR